MSRELWRPVPRWEGLYEVSTRGRVRSLPRIGKLPTGQATKIPGRILRQRIGRREYLVVWLCRQDRGQNRRTHRLVAEAFLGLLPDQRSVEVNHIDGRRQNNRLENLELIDGHGNQVHALENGLHNSAKLSAQKVRELRALYFVERYSVAHLAKQFGILPRAVTAVLRGKTWTWVPTDLGCSCFPACEPGCLTLCGQPPNGAPKRRGRKRTSSAMR
ncbi:MAG: hypothetical protein E6R03_01630 [Hyphomicrobiaceae bacterium]|nr:MAG: hypothetical protein E6R03_01630 [Hyphomicrobiaceae bacterium]